MNDLRLRDVGAAAILAVEDDPAMLRVLERFLSAAGYRVSVAEDADQALVILGGARFDLVVTDLGMPGRVGAFLEYVTSTTTPLVVTTGLERLSDVLLALGGRLPAALLAKPFSRDQLLGAVATAVGVCEHEDLEARQLAAGMARALALRDVETEAHARRVALWARLLAEDLGLSRAEIFWCEIGGLLHDIGKIGVPDAVLHKPGALDESEWVIIKRHPELGRDLLKTVPRLARAHDIVLHHHERWDGEGYPSRLAGEDIPISARIFAVADTYDAITARRPYREPASHATAVARIVEARGTQFDPRIVEAFLAIDVSRWESVRALVAASAQG